MMGQTGLEAEFNLINAVLTLISSSERLIMMVATLISEHKENDTKCLSIDEYVRITGLTASEVQKEIEILCQAQLLKPVKSKIYDITDFGRLTLGAIGVTNDLIQRYRKMNDA
jgi:hypothetical protein